MISEDMKKEAVKKALDTYSRAVDLFGIKSPLSLSFKFDLKGKTSGLAYISTGLIRFNPQLLEENVTSFILRTPPHEVAHIVAHQVYGKIKPHGPEWKHVMRRLGLDPTRCHSYKVDPPKKKRQTKIVVRCTCREGKHEMSLRLFNNIRRGKTFIYCRDSGKRIGEADFVKATKPVFIPTFES